MRRIVLIIASMLTFSSSPATAASIDDGHWMVMQRSGDARVVHAGLQPAALTANQSLAPGDTIITGSSGRASLTHGGDYILVAPRSQLRLPTKPARLGYTSIVQDLGTLLYKVRHTGIPHFAVDTTMLAAVVKGTTFTVVVEQDRSAVQVIEGVVEVTAADGGMQSLVQGGRTVFIERGNPKSLITADAVTLGKPSVTLTSAVKISGSEGEPVISVTTATAGQVRAETPTFVATSRIIATAASGSVESSATILNAASASSTSVQAPASGFVNQNVPVVTSTGAASAGPVTPGLAAPLLTVAAATVPSVTAPVSTTPAVATPVVTAPAVTPPLVTVPFVTVPLVTVPSVTVPPVTIPPVTVSSVPVPVVTAPVVIAPAITTPAVTTPVVSVPVLTTPSVIVPAVTAPIVTTPMVVAPAVTTPVITVPVVTVPALIVPAIVVPSLPVSPPPLPGR